jgi:hypothetical protein
MKPSNSGSRANYQHAGPALSTYNTGAATSIAVAQNATPGFLPSAVISESSS